MARELPYVETTWTDLQEWGRDLARTLNHVLDGRNNARGEVTLTANATTTTVTDRTVHPESRILLEPTTANAAAALGTTYATAHGNGSFMLTHDNNAQSDRVFRYAVSG